MNAGREKMRPLWAGVKVKHFSVSQPAASSSALKGKKGGQRPWTLPTAQGFFACLRRVAGLGTNLLTAIRQTQTLNLRLMSPHLTSPPPPHPPPHLAVPFSMCLVLLIDNGPEQGGCAQLYQGSTFQLELQQRHKTVVFP